MAQADVDDAGGDAFFHPTRLYYGAKLGDDIDQAFRLTLETIWSHSVTGGFRHDTAWHAYGPYLTLQLAHAFLLLSDVDRMDACLGWAVGNAAFAHISRYDGAHPSQDWQVASGAWNEQQAYPIASELAEIPDRWWYVGAIPHGWAAAELTLLLRDILFFEAGEDDNREPYLAPGVVPRWISGNGGHSISIAAAPTSCGATFGYTLRHDEPNQTDPHRHPEPAARGPLHLPCRFGQVTRVLVDGIEQQPIGGDVRLPPGTMNAEISYS